MVIAHRRRNGQQQGSLMLGVNYNSITWAKEDTMADGNRHFEHKYFTVRERVALDEIAMFWLPGDSQSRRCYYEVF